MEASNLFRRILVAVDSEGLAAGAVVRGLALANELGSRLDLVHAVDIPPPLWPGIDEHELAAMHASALATAREKTLESLAPTLPDAGREVGHLLRVHPGPPAKVILKQAEDLDADLLLLGPHAKDSLFDFGSTTRAILSRTVTPVWTEAEPAGPVKSILVPVDFSEHSQHALEYAHAVAMRLEASLRILHCFVPPTFAYSGRSEAMPGPTYVIDQERAAAKEELECSMDRFQWRSVRAESTFVEGEAAETILREADDHDLIVMGTHGRTGLSRFLMGSVAYATLKQSRKPVLVIPSPHRTWLLTEGKAQDRLATPSSID